MNEAASRASQSRGRTDNIGEGRATSRSISTDSEASARNISSQHSQADLSEDEHTTSISQTSAPAGDTSVIRPPIGYWSQNQAHGIFGFGVFSQFGPNYASGFYSPAPQPSDSLASAGLALPSEAYENRAPAFGPMTEQASMGAPQDPVAGWNSIDMPGQSPFDVFGLGSQPQNESGLDTFTQGPIQQQTFVGSEDASSQTTSSGNDIMDAFSAGGLPLFEGDLSDAYPRASSERVQDSEADSQHANQSTSGVSAPVLAPGDDGASSDYRTIVESFFAAAETQSAFSETDTLPDAGNPPETEKPPEPSNPSPQPKPEPVEDDDVVEILPEDIPIRHRTVSNDTHAPSSVPASDDDDRTSESYVPTKKKRGRKPQPKTTTKSADQRRRGKFRVKLSSTAPSPLTEPPTSTLPGKPIFTTSDPIINAETPLPYFEYKQRNRGPAQATATSNRPQQSVGPSITGTSSSRDASTERRTREDTIQQTNTNRPTPDTSTARAEASTTESNVAHLPSPGLPSAGSYATASAPSPSWQSIGGTLHEGPSLRMHYESVARLAKRETPPQHHLVTVMILDQRIPNGDPCLAELILPLSPSGESNYWLDNMFFCHALQSGPSRIDGPAKAYTFRGRFRHYFLRVSEHNEDIVAPGSIVVSNSYELRVMVEPAPPSGAPRQDPMIPPSYNNFAQLAPSNPTEPGLPSAAVPHFTQAQKRPRDPPSPSTSAAPTPGIATNGSGGLEQSNMSYYRKRAL